jgi:peptide/nickel transport system substrate-binding protein
MHPRRVRLVLGVLVLGVSLIAAGAAGGARAKATAGTMVFGAEQEPPCLNGFLEGCNNTWTSWTAGIALASPYLVYPNFSLRPYLGSGKLVKRHPMVLDVTLQKKARWSDGKPVSADDLIFTWQTIVNPKWELAGRSGWDSIAKAKKLSPKKVRFTFKTPYAAWKVMLNTSLLPKHALDGENFNEVWNSNYNSKSGASMASGPYKLQNYTKGQSITMVRNPYFWGHRPALDKLTFVFRTNTDTEIQAIRGGEVDAIYPQPQLQLAALKGQSGLRVQSNQGANTEHIDFNSGPKSSNPLLQQRWFRQAIAYSLDRNAMVRQLFRTLNPSVRPLQNLTFVPQQKAYYKAHFSKYVRNVKKVTALFKAHNCSKGGDGIWSCGGTRASVRLGTTSGNKLRELAVEILQAQAKSAGIEFRPDNQPSRLFFPRISNEDYDLALFAWVSSGDPAGQVDIYGIGGGSNWKHYNNKAVTRLFKASDAELNVKRRMADNNKADVIMANDMITLPLYQKPTYFVFKTKLHNLQDNATLQGPTWNTERWTAQ